MAVAAGLLLPLHGAEFFPIAGITSSTAATDLYPASRLIQGPGSGYDAAEPHAALGDAAGFLWVTDQFGYPSDYFDHFPPPVLTVDLGADCDLTEISLWNYSNSNRNGARDLTLRFATEADGVGGLGTSVDYQPEFSIVADFAPRQSFRFTQAVRARFVEVTITDNRYSDGVFGGDRVGLGEIAFEDTGNVSIDRIVATAPNTFEAVAARAGTPGLANLLAGENYWSAVVSPGNRMLYLSSPTAGTIEQVPLDADPAVSTVLATRANAVFHGLAVDEANQLIYALNSDSDALEIYQQGTGSYFGALASGFQRPNELFHDAPGNRLIISDSGLDKLFIYNRAGTLLDELSDPSTVGAWGVTVDPATSDILYSSHDRGEIWRWSPGSTPTLEASGLSGPRGLVFDRWGRLHCVEAGADRVTVIGSNPALEYASAPGGRDVATFNGIDLNGNLLPDAWEEAAGLDTTPGIAFGSDFDGDGLSDGLEAAVGSGATGGAGPPQSLTPEGSGQVVVRHRALLTSDYHYRLYLSDDLGGWQEIPRLPETTPVDGLYEEWTYRFDPADYGFVGTGRLFSRVDVQLRD